MKVYSNFEQRRVFLTKLLKLVSARVEDGYINQPSFVRAINAAGIVVSGSKYARIEAGKQNIDFELAIAIADFLRRDPREIFLRA